MNIVVFDIETVKNQERFDTLVKPFKKERPTFPSFDEGTVKLGNLKDEEKIAQKIKDAEAKYEAECKEKIEAWEKEQIDYYENAEDKAAIYPAYSEICAIGYQFPGTAPVALMVGDGDIKDEKQLVETFLAHVMEMIDGSRNGRVGVQFGFWSGNWNRNSAFDVNHIEWACIRHGIKLPGELFEPPGSFRQAYWKDLSEFMFRAGPLVPDMETGYLGLNRAAELLGLHGTVADVFDDHEFSDDGKIVEWTVADKDDLDVEGASFGRWLQAGEFEQCRIYLLNDLCLTRAVANCNPFLG